VPVALTIFTGLIVAFGLVIDDDEAPPLFGEDLREATEDVGLKATAFNQMMLGINSVDRIELDTIVDDVLSSLATARAVMAEAPENDPELTGPLAILREALTSWESGVSVFRELVFEAADDPLASALEIELTDALIDLRAGDRLFSSFVRAIDAADTPAPVLPYPTVAFVSDSYPFSTGPAQIIAVAQAPGNELALRAELAIEQVVTSPEMSLNTSDQRVVTATSALTVQVVIFNAGNTASEPVELTLSVVGTDDSALAETAEVGAIAAGGQTTVEFADLVVSPGLAYQMVISLPLMVGEEATDDNRVQWDFLVNEETTPTTVAG
jgi:hypothetical protein